MQVNSKYVNGKNIIIGILSAMVGGLLIVSLNLTFNRSQQAYDTAAQAQQTAVSNRERIAVIEQRLSTIERGISEIKDMLKEK